MVPLANQIVYEEKFFFMKVFQPNKERKNDRNKNDHFVSPMISESTQWASTAVNIMKES